MSVEKFIPSIWASAIETPYRASLVYSQPNVASTRFQNILQDSGRSVEIPHIGTGNIRKHDRNTDLTYDDVTLSTTTLEMNQELYFGFRVNDVDKVQAAGEFQGAVTEEHAHRLAREADGYVAKIAAKDASKKLTKKSIFNGADYYRPGDGQETAWDVLRELSTELNKVSAPSVNRWVVVGSNFASALLADRRFTEVDKAGTDSVLRSGNLGAVQTLGFTVLTSPAVPEKSGAETIIAGVPGAIAYASQLQKIEAMRDPNRFGDLVRGLLVFGAGVINPDGVVTVDVSTAKGQSIYGGSPASPAPSEAA